MMQQVLSLGHVSSADSTKSIVKGPHVPNPVTLQAVSGRRWMDG